MNISTSHKLNRHLDRHFSEIFNTVIAEQNEFASQTTGELFLEAINNDAYISFASEGEKA